MSAGLVSGCPATARFARLIRCAMVASGTRNASATCLVVRPDDGPEGESDRRPRAERRMAAQEQQEQGVVDLFRRARLPVVRGRVLPSPARRFRAPGVDELPGGDGDEPGRRGSRQPVRPVLMGFEQRFLDGVLGRGEVVSAADEGTQRLRGGIPPRFVVHSVVAGGSPITGRTSSHS